MAQGKTSRRPSLKLKLKAIRCVLCNLTANTKWARPFTAESTATGHIILCRLCRAGNTGIGSMRVAA